MKRALLFVMLLACNKTDTQTTTSASASASASPPPPPFTGTLTGDRVMGAKGMARPFDKWEAARAKLEGQMGKQTFVKDDKVYWAASQGDDCWYMMAEKQKDGTVGMVQDPMKVSKGGPIMNWDECLTAAGVRKEAVEDANAAGPPTDGKPIALASLIDGATKAKSKWTGAKLTVKATYGSTSTSTSGDKTYKTITLITSKSDFKKTVSCSMADPNAEPKLLQYDPVVATGTVKVNEMMSLGGGERSLEVELENCSLVKGK